MPISIKSAASQIAQLQENCAKFGVELFDLKSDQRGIVHVIGPEFGFTQPGQTIVCGDSHTSTHGAFGALAFGIGTTEVGHVLATQCLLQRRPRTFAIKVDGALSPGVTAKGAPSQVSYELPDKVAERVASQATELVSGFPLYPGVDLS